jgi:hypothetical protein
MTTIDPSTIKVALQQARDRSKLPNGEDGPFDHFLTSYFANGIVSASKIDAVKQEIARITAAGASPQAIGKAEDLLKLCEKYKEGQNLSENILAKIQDVDAKLDEYVQRKREQAFERSVAERGLLNTLLDK